MKVLVAVASKYGSTLELARTIGQTLSGGDIEATVVDVAEQVDVDGDGYDAAVVGSGVYAGHWLKDARTFVERNGEFLRGMPVWLFSSGPIGDPPKPEEDPVDVADLMEQSGARDHAVFAGRIDRDGLKFADKAIVRALRVPGGDYRDFEAVRRWAADIGEALREQQ